MKTKSILLLLFIASAMIQVLLYLCLCLFLQLSRTRPWWRLSISWWRLRTRTSWTTPRAPRRPNSRVSLIKLLAATISGGVGFGHSGHVMTVENRQFRRIFVSIEKSYYGIIPVVKIKNIWCFNSEFKTPSMTARCFLKIGGITKSGSPPAMSSQVGWETWLGTTKLAGDHKYGPHPTSV